MNEKLLWFGRYLMCQYWYKHHSHKENEYCVDKLTTSDLYCNVNNRHYECKLILKELKDISDEDFNSLIVFLKETFPKETKGTDFCNINKDYLIKSLVNLDASYVVVDFLRSKGYAIGIPREYYITEEEINKLKEK
jgi:hypothetical protein